MQSEHFDYPIWQVDSRGPGGDVRIRLSFADPNGWVDEAARAAFVTAVATAAGQIPGSESVYVIRYDEVRTDIPLT
jgi:hypothetical protein